MIEQFGELIFSQENQPGTSKSTRKIAEQLNIHRSSVQGIVNHQNDHVWSVGKKQGVDKSAW